MKNADKTTPKNTHQLKPYSKPELVKYGELKQLTVGSSGPKNEPQNPLPRPQ